MLPSHVRPATKRPAWTQRRRQSCGCRARASTTSFTAGPLLVLITAGAGDANSYDNLIDRLASHYTVLTYDRRGYSRSTRDDPAQPLEVETHSADVAQLLSVLTADPGYVFGSSGGGVVGLDLAIRYPAKVCRLVAHEPPTRQLLPDDGQLHGGMYEIYRRDGAEAAIRHFAASIGVNPDRRAREPGVEVSKPNAWSAPNLEFFLAHDVPAVARYSLDLTALKDTPARIMPAAGIASRMHWPYRCAAALAEQLDTDLVEFPGDHAGFVTHPQAFADRLHQALHE
ncbi:alpha/beta fold hydrolase [Micromonospora globispora]|nr:alpha/beta fold hydrolase [Micromonospora globispora]